MKTGGKKERRSQKDKRKSDRLKGKRPAKGQGTKSKDLKTVLDSARENQKDQGVAGLAGAGRGGTIPSKKDKAKRPGRKQKHKKNLKDASQLEADEASLRLATIRLAHTKPELRPLLLPLLKAASRKVEASQYQSIPAKDVKVGDVVLLDANMMRSSRPTTVVSVTVRSRTVGIEHVARPGQSKPFYVALEKNDPVDVRRG